MLKIIFSNNKNREFVKLINNYKTKPTPQTIKK